MTASGWESYDPEQDSQGLAWAQERTALLQHALDRHGAWVKEQQEAKEELRAQVWLSAAAGRVRRKGRSAGRSVPMRILRRRTYTADPAFRAASVDAHEESGRR
jgi:hypothetical protein